MVGDRQLKGCKQQEADQVLLHVRRLTGSSNRGMKTHWQLQDAILQMLGHALGASCRACAHRQPSSHVVHHRALSALHAMHHELRMTTAQH